jgi:hypothetical protein
MPVELAFSILLAISPLTFVHGSVSPLEVAIAVHLIIGERTLKDFTFRGHTTAKAMALALIEVPFVN